MVWELADLKTQGSSGHQGQIDYLFKAAIDSKPNITPRHTHFHISAEDKVQ